MKAARLKTSALISVSLLIGCTSTEDKVNDLAQRHMDSFVFVEGGTFMMGNPGGWSIRRDTIPAHKVTLDSFSIQKYEVTQGDMELFMEATGYVSSDDFYEKFKKAEPNRFANELPALASWFDARAFCQWVGRLNDRKIDLPTEAQWEYAARSRGKMLRYATDTGEATAGVNMAPAAKGIINNPDAIPAPPGSFPPNPLGLYDMSGNVAEWVMDNYQPDYYQHSPEHNPQGPGAGQTSKTLDDILGKTYEQKVAKGGRYIDFRSNTTVTKINISDGLLNQTTGFRCSIIK